MTCWPKEWIEAAIKADLAFPIDGGMSLRVMDLDTLRDRLGNFAAEITGGGEAEEEFDPARFIAEYADRQRESRRYEVANACDEVRVELQRAMARR